MLVLLSPSKTQEFETAPPVRGHTQPVWLGESELIMRELRKLSRPAIGELMEVSEKIAALNYGRYKSFSTPFTPANAKPAAFAFQGDVYDGLEAEKLDKAALAFAQTHLRILSGLYGVLRPLDLIQPYRLEMKIRLKNPRGKDLYAFWGSRITDALAADVKAGKARAVVNCASEEYFKAVKPAALGAALITPQFKEKKGKDYKMVALFAKRARGAMAKYICENQLVNPDDLQGFDADGYRFNPSLSTAGKPVFTRG